MIKLTHYLGMLIVARRDFDAVAHKSKLTGVKGELTVDNRQEQVKLDAIEYICEKLTSRSAVLFLGAGINYGLKNADGLSFPLGQGLADLMTEKLLESSDFHGPLDDIAEFSVAKVGARSVNEFIYKLMESFEPGPAQLSLVQLPWDVIYTTNYDRLVEKSTSINTIKAAGRICPVFSTKTVDMSDFSEDDIPYYKLHGSVEVANTDDGRLILTKDDYRYYEKHRKRLFARLSQDLSKKTFVFVGYSLVDNNLRALLDDCREELGVTSNLPLSFAIRPGFQDIEESFYRDKFNIQMVRAKGDEFLNDLKDSWFAHNRTVIPFELRRERGHDTDDGSSFEKVGDCYYQVTTSGCGGKSEPKNFFRGGEPTWADVRDGIAPKRDLYWTILDALLAELTQPDLPSSCYLITGSAGTGKSTLTKTLAFDIAKDIHFAVLVHIPGTPFDAGVLATLLSKSNVQRIVLIVDHAAENIRQLVVFQQDLRQRRLPVTLLLEERKNQWLVSTSSIGAKIVNAEFELETLSKDEICVILDALEKHNCLGKLTGTDRAYQEDHFIKLAQKELLVALRELTSDGTFDEIIKDEYEKISSNTAKEAYVYVSALGQIDLPVRYATLQHVLGLSWTDFRKEIFTPTAGILISGEEIGRSRHNADFRLRVRHPIIGSVIFATAAPNDHTKFDLINRLIEKLDPGHLEDKRLLNAIVKGDELIGTFSSAEFKRAIYDRLADALPDDSYVFQHRSNLERNLNEPKEALKYARMAATLSPNHPFIQNTLGLALEACARNAGEKEQLAKRGWIAEASKIFKEEIARSKRDPYGYLGTVLLLRLEASEEKDKMKQSVLKAKALSVLEEAMDETSGHSVIVTQLGLQWKMMGNAEEAIKILEDALSKESRESRLRELLITLLERKGETKKAYDLALAGATIDPTFWRMQRHIARLAKKIGLPTATVKGHYEAALRHNKGDISLIVELAALLFMNGQPDEAEKYFVQAKGLSVSGSDKAAIGIWWEEKPGTRKQFSGKISKIRGAIAFVLSVPENIEAQFWKTYADMADLKVGDTVSFQIGFNAFGPAARIRLRR